METEVLADADMDAEPLAEPLADAHVGEREMWLEKKRACAAANQAKIRHKSNGEPKV